MNNLPRHNATTARAPRHSSRGIRRWHTCARVARLRPIAGPMTSANITRAHCVGARIKAAGQKSKGQGMGRASALLARADNINSILLEFIRAETARSVIAMVGRKRRDARQGAGHRPNPARSRGCLQSGVTISILIVAEDEAVF